MNAGANFVKHVLTVFGLIAVVFFLFRFRKKEPQHITAARDKAWSDYNALETAIAVCSTESSLKEMETMVDDFFKKHVGKVQVDTLKALTGTLDSKIRAKRYNLSRTGRRIV